jgi:predicted transcriptional regulator
VLQFKQMSNTITVRLPVDLAEWLTQTARKTGLPRGRIIREELEKARNSEARPFLRLAGAIAGPKDLSTRKGYSKK